MNYGLLATNILQNLIFRRFTMKNNQIIIKFDSILFKM